MEARRRSTRWPFAVLVGLVTASSVARFAASLEFTVPWIAPDEMLYGLVGESLWEHGSLTVRGLATPYYSLLYPAVVGLPLSLFDVADGIRVVQAIQAVLVSLTAVPVYLWGRRFLPRRWAVGAAALTLALPGLAYSGLLMTEALYLPLTVTVLATLAWMLERPTAVRQGLFLGATLALVLVRLQALVLVPTLLVAVLLFARVTGSREVLRRLAPLAGVAVLGAVAAAVVVAVRPEASWESLLGGYAPVVESQRGPGALVVPTLWQTAGLGVLTLGLPLLAAVVVAARGLAHGEAEPASASFVAVLAAYVPLLLLEVGAFATEFLDHASERYLLTAAPPLFLAFCLWAARGGARSPRAVAGVAALGLVVLMAVVPLRQVATATAVHDAFTTSPLVDLVDGDRGALARSALLLGAAASAAALLVLPRRLLGATVACVGAGLATLSLFATGEVRARSAERLLHTIGSSDPEWVDAVADDGVAYLATGEWPWTAVARTFFWNRSITEVVALRGADVLVPAAPTAAALGADGLITDSAGRPLRRRLVLAPSTVTLAGTDVARQPVLDGAGAPLVLWRTDTPLRVVLERVGFSPNGDALGPVAVVVPRCVRGNLLVTMLGKSGAPIEVAVNGARLRRLRLAQGDARTAILPSPAGVRGVRPCRFTFESPGLFGTTTIDYVPST